MEKLTVITWMFGFLYLFCGAQDVTLSGPGPCNAGAVTGTWTVPCHVTSITVEVYGGGGGAGGGGGGSNGGFFNTRGGGGGGGGGYATITINVIPNTSFSYAIGAGGCGGNGGPDGVDGDDGSSGGNSTFTGTDAGGMPVNVTANGGARGTGGDGRNGSPGSGGAGGSASGGSTNATGTAGNSGSGGTGGNGGAGAGPSGGGGGAANSGAGNTYGGGGAGGGDSPGGRGAAGGILITYVTANPLPAVPVISSVPPTCISDGISTISNYDAAMTYIFTPAGPSAGAGGVISGMAAGTSYTVVASDGNCSSAPSAPFSNAAQLAPPAVPAITSTPPTCISDGISTIGNYDAAMTYIFTPAGPSAGAGGVISGMAAGTSYTVVASDGNCSSASSAPFSNAAQLAVPVASIIGSLTYCTGSNTTLTASGGTGYAWTDAGGNNIGNSASVTVTQGTYTVIVTNASGCADTAVAAVAELASVSVNISGALNYCPGGNTTLTATGGTSYVWDDAGSSTTAGITVRAGTYSVTATDANNCTGTATATVTEFPLPVISISGALSYCAGANTTLTANGGVSYVWNDAGSSTTASITVAQGNYTVTGTDANSCTATASATVAENALPAANISGSLTYCTGGNTTLTASGGVAYLWSNAATTVSITVTQGTYTVTVTDANNCSGTASATVTESTNLTVNISGALSYCPGANTTLTATGGTSYTWSNGSVAASIAVTQGAYSVTATDAGCSGTSSAVVTEIVTTPVNLGSNITACEDSLVLLDAGSGYASYAWSNGNTTRSIYPQTSGTYSVTVVDANSCTVSGMINVVFDECLVVAIPSAFSPNGDGINEIFRVRGENAAEFQIMIFNRWGEKVFESNSMNDGWDGTYKGEHAEIGAYVYYATINKRTYKGSITLIR